MTTVSKKSATIQQMFDRIVPTYDFLNSFLSLGCDRYWRRKSAQLICAGKPKRILDVCCGTGEFSRVLQEEVGDDGQVFSGDFSEKMIQRAHQKYSSRWPFLRANCMCLPFADNSFDAVTVAWGIRNVEERSQSLGNMFRVCKQGGRICILEFFPMNANPIFSRLFLFYFKHILPIIGAIVSRETNAYTYLPQSVEEFPSVEHFFQELIDTGYTDRENIIVKQFMFGVSVMVMATKTKNGEIQ